MIDFFSTWTKNITLSLIVISLIEMLIPNTKFKKYIKVVMGIYLLFNIISPFVNKNISFDLENLINEDKSKIVSSDIKISNQESMNVRLKKICEEELKKDVINKVENLGYIVDYCNIDVVINDMNKIDKTTKINKIILNINKTKKEEKKEPNTIENKLVKQIDKIKKVNIENKNSSFKDNNKKADLNDFTNIKKMLIKEYGVDEKCLKIN